MSPLSRDLAICRERGKWLSEFYALSDEEQEVERYSFTLERARQGYYAMAPEDRQYWPNQAPARVREQPGRIKR